MHRIAALPRRDWHDLVAETVPALTSALKTEQGSQTLRDFQAVGLRELTCLGGAYLMGDVGIGKTLITLLAGELMGEERVLILVPSGDKSKTEDEFEAYREHWTGIDGTKYKLFGYGDVSRFPKEGMSIQGLWGGLGPTLIICDEADKLRRVDVNKGASGLALQISDYMHANSSCKLLALTATPEKSSIKDYWHILAWCLGEKSPLPIEADDIDDWSEVIDKGDPRCARKVCTQLGIPVTYDTDVIRDAYHDRLHSAPGVLISDAGFDGPLEFESILLPPWGMEPHFAKLREFNQRPDGWDLSPDEPSQEDQDRQPDRVTAGGVWATERQLALGFCYIADPVPPMPWMEARRLCFKAIRLLLRKREYYTAQQVWQAHALGQLRPAHMKALTNWKNIQPTFEPGSRALWLSDHALDFCQEWGEEAPGIIFVDHIAFGHELSKRTGWEYFGAGGKNNKGKRIDALYKLGTPAKQTVIARRGSCGTGKNLQAWNRLLFTALPANNRDFQQNVGREHRLGQWRPVKADLLVGCKAHVESISKILVDAQRQSATLLKQKATSYPWRHVTDLPKGLFFND
jgi:hypothetical protein